jgi:hypothetical protein
MEPPKIAPEPKKLALEREKIAPEPKKIAPERKKTGREPICTQRFGWHIENT